MISRDELKLNDRCWSVNVLGNLEEVEIVDLSNSFCEVKPVDGGMFYTVRYSELFHSQEEAQAELSYREYNAQMNDLYKDEKPKRRNDDFSTDDDLTLSRDNEVDDLGSDLDDGFDSDEPLFDYNEDDEFPDFEDVDDEEVDDEKGKKDKNKDKKDDKKKKKAKQEELVEEEPVDEFVPQTPVAQDEYLIPDLTDIQDPLLFDDEIVQPTTQFPIVDEPVVDGFSNPVVPATPVMPVVEPEIQTPQFETPVVEEPSFGIGSHPVSQPVEEVEGQGGFVLGDDGRIHSVNYEENAELARNVDQSVTAEYNMIKTIEEQMADAASKGGSFAQVEHFESNNYQEQVQPIADTQLNHPTPQNDVVTQQSDVVQSQRDDTQNSMHVGGHGSFVHTQHVVDESVVPGMYVEQTVQPDPTIPTTPVGATPTGYTPVSTDPNVVTPVVAPVGGHVNVETHIPVQNNNGDIPASQHTQQHIVQPNVGVAPDNGQVVSPAIDPTIPTQTYTQQPVGHIPPVGAHPVGGVDPVAAATMASAGVVHGGSAHIGGADNVQPERVVPVSGSKVPQPQAHENIQNQPTQTQQTGQQLGANGMPLLDRNQALGNNNVGGNHQPVPSGVGGSHVLNKNNEGNPPAPSGSSVPDGPNNPPPGGPGGGGGSNPPGGADTKQHTGINNDTDKWNRDDPDNMKKGGPHSYHETERPAIDQLKLKADGVKQKTEKAEERLGSKMASTIKQSIEGASNIEEDKSNRQRKTLTDGVIGMASALGAAGVLDAENLKNDLFKQSVNNASDLLANGKVKLADFQANDGGKALEQALTSAGYSKSDIKRIISQKDDIAGFFEMKEAAIGDLKSRITGLGVELPKNASIDNMKEALHARISKFQGMEGVDVSKLSVEDLTKIIDANTAKKIASLPVMSKEDRENAIKAIHREAGLQKNTLKSLSEVKAMSNMTADSYDGLAAVYASLSKNDQIAALAPLIRAVDKDGNPIPNHMLKRMSSKEIASRGITTRIGKLSDDQIKELLKKAKKDPSFSFADKTLLRRELDRRARAKVAAKAPSLGKFSGALAKMMTRFADEASGANGFGTMSQMIAYGRSAVGLLSTSGNYFYGKIAKTGKKISEPAKKIGTAIVENEKKVWTARYENLQKKNETVKKFEDKRLEKARAKKEAKAEKKTNKQNLKAKKKADRVSRFENSKIGKGYKKAGEMKRKMANSKAGRAATAAKNAGKKAAGAAGKVVSAPFNILNAAKALVFKIIGALLAVFIITYFVAYLITGITEISSSVMEGFNEAVGGIMDWLLGRDSRSPYDILQDLYNEAKKREQHVNQKATEMANGTPKDPYVLAGHKIDRYSHTRIQWVNSEGEIISYSEVNTKKSAVALAYVLAGDDEFYTMDKEAKRQLVRDLYDYMSGEDNITISETPLGDVNTTSGNIYLCDKQRISAIEGPCEDVFYYHCTGDEYYDDKSTLQYYMNLGVGVYKNGGHTEQHSTSSVMQYKTYGCYVDYTAQCAGHYVTDKDCGGDTDEIIGVWYHYGEDEWEGTEIPINFENDILNVGYHRKVVFEDFEGNLREYYAYSDTCDNYYLVDWEAKCDGHHSIPVCYGHKDATISIMLCDYKKVTDNKYIPNCPDTIENVGENYDKYLEGFEWTVDNIEQTRRFIEDGNWFDLYGITD